MKHLALTLLSFALVLFFSFCKKETAEILETIMYPNFSQLKVGNYWIYERYRIEDSGMEISTGTFDSCYVEKDTQINNYTYYKVLRPSLNETIQTIQFIRDSLHYLVTNDGEVLFSSQNYVDTLQQYHMLFVSDTICEVVAKMADKNLAVSTPAGVFETSSLKRTFHMYPLFADLGNTRYMDTRYAENIGIVSETLTFFAFLPVSIEIRLVRYHLN